VLSRVRRLSVLLLIVLLAGCTLETQGRARPVHHIPRTTPAASRSATHRAERAAAPPALQALQRLPVKGRAPLTGYDRDLFGPAWTDDNDDPLGHNGCDTRNDILRRDLTHTVIEAGTQGCVVLTGTLADPYGGTTIHFVRGVTTSTEVQIDHVVALADAWQTGAQRWSPQRLRDFANDPLELLAVDGPLNEGKGDGDAATWLPPDKAERCDYVARQIAVKATWDLWVKPAERDAMTRILQGCPGQRLPRS
jgi:hypothetical protein